MSRGRALLAALALLWPAGARGAGAEQWQLGLAVAYAAVADEGSSPHGGGIGADLQYGLDDAWALRGSVVGSLHPAAGEDQERRAVRAVSAFAGVTYALDVLRVVPYLDLGVGFLWRRGGDGRSHARAGLEAGIGADYLWSRRLSVGFLARYHFAVSDPQGEPFYVWVGPRLSWLWGW